MITPAALQLPKKKNTLPLPSMRRLRQPAQKQALWPIGYAMNAARSFSQKSTSILFLQKNLLSVLSDMTLQTASARDAGMHSASVFIMNATAEPTHHQIPHPTQQGLRPCWQTLPEPGTPLADGIHPLPFPALRFQRSHPKP